MSTIPSTSNPPTYTVIGGEFDDDPGKRISVIVVGKSDRLSRSEHLGSLVDQGFRDIIAVEGPAVPYDLEALAKGLRYVRFLTVHEDYSDGRRINLAMSETRHRWVLVIAASTDVVRFPFGAASLQERADFVCLAPQLLDDEGNVVPTMVSPAFRGRRLRLVYLQPNTDGAPTLFPFNYFGLYDRERFFSVEGYDEQMTDSHYQKLDFGFRAHLWGERIRFDQRIQLRYRHTPVTEDTTPNQDYNRFFLKNLAVRFDRDRGLLPSSQLLPYLFRSGDRFSQGIRNFREVRAWVRKHQYRFTLEARGLTDLWEVPS